jgi:hypothetical protein
MKDVTMYQGSVPALLLALCVLLAACSGKSSGPDSPGAAATWPVKWCQAHPGMAKEELVSLMGQPTDTSAKQMTWSDDHYRFYAFLEQDGTVRQLDINQVDLTPAEKAGLQCKDARTLRSERAQAAAKAASNYHSACELVTQSAMSTILGAPVVSAGSGSASGQSKCVYTPATGSTPYAELSVDRGDGEAGMAGVGFMQKNVPGMVNPYDGIGDQAVAVGPALYIRTGDDLVTIVLSGVKNSPTAARTIFNAVKAGM